MTRKQNSLAEKVGRLTQRLDTKLADPDLSPEENARASAELVAIATQLTEILPDPSFSTEERLERLARAVSHATPNPVLMEPDTKKLVRVKARLNELMSGDELTGEQKVAKLGELFYQAFPEFRRNVA